MGPDRSCDSTLGQLWPDFGPTWADSGPSVWHLWADFGLPLGRLRTQFGPTWLFEKILRPIRFVKDGPNRLDYNSWLDYNA